MAHLDGKNVERGDIDSAASEVTSNIKADAEDGTYNYGPIIKVKVLGSSTDESYTFSNAVESLPVSTPRSSTEGITSAKESRTPVGFFVGLALLCAGLLATILFAIGKKKGKKHETELDELAQAYYDGDDRTKFGPWDVLSLSSDGRTLTSSVIDPSLNPAETAKDVHICSSAMCTECSTRKNRSHRVQFIPCVGENAAACDSSHDDDEKSF